MDDYENLIVQIGHDGDGVDCDDVRDAIFDLPYVSDVAVWHEPSGFRSVLPHVLIGLLALIVGVLVGYHMGATDAAVNLGQSESLIAVHGAYYEASAPDRPACFAEPSETPERVEIIYYPNRALRTHTEGLEVLC